MMISKIKYEDARKNSVFIDVRSPSEYKEDCITGAINIPLLNDEERRIVGTAYIQISKDEARRLGVNIISPKMPQIFEQIIELKKQNKQIVVYCAKGGYRSTFFTSVFCSIGIFLLQMEGGYKSYRKSVMESIPKLNADVKYIVIHGNTGVGKTNILNSLKAKGYNILDLEGAANHRGSMLGSIGIGDCNSQKNFETNIYYQLDNITSEYVFVEAESKKIGKVIVPECINDSMETGIHINVEADMDYRVASLKNDYILSDKWIEESVAALESLRKYISKEKIRKLEIEIKNGNFEYAAKELMENYYDPMYMYKSDECTYLAEFRAETNSDDVADEIIQRLKKYIKI